MHECHVLLMRPSWFAHSEDHIEFHSTTMFAVIGRAHAHVIRRTDSIYVCSETLSTCPLQYVSAKPALQLHVKI